MQLQSYCSAPNLSRLASTGRTSANTNVAVALLACAALSGLLLVLSVVAVGVRLKCRRDLFKLVDGYITIDPPLVGSGVLIIYAAMGLAACFLVRAHLLTDSSPGRFVYLVVLLPAPLFFWSFMYALGAASSAHTLAREASPLSARFSLRPKVFNNLAVAVSAAVILDGVLGVPLALAVLFDRMRIAVHFAVSMEARGEAVDWHDALVKCSTADLLYRATWALWCLMFSVALLIHVAYASLLQERLRVQITFLDVGSPFVEIPSDSPFVEVSKGRPADKALATIKRSMMLKRVETSFFILYSLPWVGIGLFKAVVGLNVFDSVSVWGWILVFELLVATVCSSLTLIAVIHRGISIFRTQRRVLHRTHPGFPTIQVTVRTDIQVDTRLDDDEDELESPLPSPFAVDIPNIGDSVTPPVSPIRVRFPSIVSLGTSVGTDMELREDQKLLSNPETTPRPPRCMQWEAPPEWEMVPAGAEEPAFQFLPRPVRGVMRRGVSFENASPRKSKERRSSSVS